MKQILRKLIHRRNKVCEGLKTQLTKDMCDFLWKSCKAIQRNIKESQSKYIMFIRWKDKTLMS